MLLQQTQPLDLAKHVLKADTLQAVAKKPFNYQGWKILDRWAFNSPRQLQALEAEGEVVLLGRLLDQQNLEHKVLTLQESLEALATGTTEHELLQMHQVATEL